MSKLRSLFVFLILEALFEMGQSMRFELKSGGTKCISEDINTHKLTVRVTSPHGNAYHQGDHVESGNFAFTASETGDHTVCFWAPEHKPPVSVTVEFDWKSGVAAKDWSQVAKKGQIRMMEVEVKQLLETVKSIHNEIYYLRGREFQMQHLNRSTNTSMAALSCLSLVVCLSVAGLQIWHLKTFFERKKLL